MSYVTGWSFQIIANIYKSRIGFPDRQVPLLTLNIANFEKIGVLIYYIHVYNVMVMNICQTHFDPLAYDIPWRSGTYEYKAV